MDPSTTSQTSTEHGSPSTRASELTYDPEIFDGIHRQNLRGLSTWKLVAEMQSIEQEVMDWETIFGGVPSDELWFAMRYQECVLAEVRRRESVSRRAQADPRQIEVRALKDLCVGGEWYNLVGHYVEVVVYGGAYKYRCALHGDGRDTDPSGALYPDGRWWCYGCNKGGDVFDWLMTYGRLTFREAAALLGRMYGLGRGNGDK